MKVAGPSPISLIIIFRETISLKNRGIVYVVSKIEMTLLISTWLNY